MRLEIEGLADETRLVVLPPPCPQSIPPSDFSRATELIRRGREDVPAHLAELDVGRVTAPVRMCMHSHGAGVECPGGVSCPRWGVRSANG
jgi:NTE family protein